MCSLQQATDTQSCKIVMIRLTVPAPFMNLTNLCRSASLVLLALGIPAAKGEVKLPRILSSRMVLQRDRPIHLWGWSEPGEKISASINGASQSTTADRLGTWELYLPPQSAGG